MKLVDLDTARKVLETVDCGLVLGLGKPEPGKMCVEAAVCYAMGLPHGDDPGCVSPALRAFKITLNDAKWSSPHARAAGLRGLAIAQLGSKDVLNDAEFVRRLIEAMIREILPDTLRLLIPLIPSHAVYLEAAAKRCQIEGSVEAAAEAAEAAAWADVAEAAGVAAEAADVARVAGLAGPVDTILLKSANIALDILRDLNTPGIVLMDQLIPE